MEQSALTSGRLLDGKYRVERILGVGGMGIVVAAIHLHLNKRVALKFLTCEAQENPETVLRFLREGRALAQLSSLHVARIMDVGRLETNEPYLVMEYLEGTDLSRLLKSRGPLSPSDAILYVLQACEGVADAHALGIIHRDLKPSNLFLAETPRDEPAIKVLDFGISKITTELAAACDISHATNTGALMGSPHYMSPEQIRDARRVDKRTDVWSLGVVLHELLTGTLPFHATTLSGTLAAIAADAPVPLRRVCADAPEALEPIILRCLEKHVDTRYSSVAELATALLPLVPESVRARLPRSRLSPSPITVSSLAPATLPDGENSCPTQLATARAYHSEIGLTQDTSRMLLLSAIALFVVVGAVASTSLFRTSSIRHAVTTAITVERPHPTHSNSSIPKAPSPLNLPREQEPINAAAVSASVQSHQDAPPQAPAQNQETRRKITAEANRAEPRKRALKSPAWSNQPAKPIPTAQLTNEAPFASPPGEEEGTRDRK